MHTKHKHIDFITLTSEGLKTVHQLAEGSRNDIGNTIYGAYFNNDEAYKRFGDAPSATTHDLEFLKILTVCNAIPNVFKDCKIGRLQCVNIYSGESRIADSKIISHYSKLANAIGNPNHLNKEIKLLNQEHRWFFELNYLLSQMGDSTLKSTILSQLNKLTSTSYYDYHLLLERVRDLKTSIESAYNFGSLEINKMMSFHTLPEKLYAAVCALEATYKKFQWENEEDFSTLNLQGG